MSKTYSNLAEIVTVTLRNRTGEFVRQMTASNKFLLGMINPWEPQERGAVKVSDFIELSARGKAKMENGRVYLLKDKKEQTP